MLWSCCRLLLLLHRLLSLRLLLQFWIVLLQDLLGADPRLVAGRLELASGWIRSDASIRAALVQASTTCDEEKEATLEAKAARDAALGEAVRNPGGRKGRGGGGQGPRGGAAEKTRPP